MAAGINHQKETIGKLKETKSDSNDAIILEKIYGNLLEIKAGVGQAVDLSINGFISCWLIIQTIIRSSKKCKFRIKQSWSGLFCKKEIEKLYEIPAQHQVLIINERVVSDQQTLDGFDIKPFGQIVYVFLTKKKINYAESQIRISDIIPPRDVEMGDEEGAVGGVESDGSSGCGTSVDGPIRSQSGNRNSRNRRKKKNKKR